MCAGAEQSKAGTLEERMRSVPEYSRKIVNERPPKPPPAGAAEPVPSLSPSASAALAAASAAFAAFEAPATPANEDGRCRVRVPCPHRSAGDGGRLFLARAHAADGAARGADAGGSSRRRLDVSTAAAARARALRRFLVQIGQPLFDERLVQPARFQILVRVRVGDPAILGTVVHHEPGAMGIEDPLDALE